VLVITTKSVYAVKAMTELARRGADPVPIGDIAAARGIPAQFLESIFGQLRRGGLLQSHRGVKGGYSFGRPPEEITVLEVVELLEGELGSPDAESVWGDAVGAVRATLSATTIAAVAEREAQQAGAPMYYI
jgi:Rrf2 family transcriptional regulator, cysteine metabolism repressor